LVGYAILAVGCLFFFIPSLPEVLHSVHLATGINLDDHSLNDKASGIYNTFLNLGSIIGPPLGGILNDFVGYRLTNDIVVIFSLAFAFAYLICNLVLYPDDNAFGDGSSIYSLSHTQQPHGESSSRNGRVTGNKNLDESRAGNLQLPMGQEIESTKQRLKESLMPPRSSSWTDAKESILLEEDAKIQDLILND
jgi:hypothetical protein